MAKGNQNRRVVIAAAKGSRTKMRRVPGERSIIGKALKDQAASRCRKCGSNDNVRLARVPKGTHTAIELRCEGC